MLTSISLNDDTLLLRSLCDDLRRKSKMLEMYRINESCENIRIASTKMDEEDRAGHYREEAAFLHTYCALTSLKASVTSTRAALDSFDAAS